MVADFAGGIDSRPLDQKPFNLLMWIFKRMSWIITSIQEVAVLLPFVCPPRTLVTLHMYVHQGEHSSLVFPH